MSIEQDTKQQLETKFNYLKDQIQIRRDRRMFADIPLDSFREVLDHSVKQLGFSFLSSITGLDEGNTFGVIYHLGRQGVLLNLRIHIARDNPVIKTITDYFPCAENYERELADLLGIKVDGLPPGRRYPLPDDWPSDQYPLRKDWKGKIPSGIDTEVKNG